MAEDISGNITVNMQVSGGDFRGGRPRAPGAGGPPSEGAEAFFPQGFQPLTPQQQEQLKLAREAQRLQKEASEYQKISAGAKDSGTGSPASAFSAIAKFLPFIAGGAGIIALVKSSKIMSTTMETIGSTIGALVDIFLLPFVPLLIQVMQGMVKIIPPVMRFIQSVMEIGWAETITKYAKDAWKEIDSYAKQVWQDIKAFAISLLPSWLRPTQTGEASAGAQRIRGAVETVLFPGTSWEQFKQDFTDIFSGIPQKVGDIFFGSKLWDNLSGNIINNIVIETNSPTNLEGIRIHTERENQSFIEKIYRRIR